MDQGLQAMTTALRIGITALEVAPSHNIKIYCSYSNENRDTLIISDFIVFPSLSFFYTLYLAG